MTRTIRWTTRAADQLQAAALYLEHSRPGSGLQFVEDVQATLHIAAAHPRIFPRVPLVEGAEVRRTLVRRFGYWAIYQFDPTDVLAFDLARRARARGSRVTCNQPGTARFDAAGHPTAH